jgi:hypothetical protein
MCHVFPFSTELLDLFEGGSFWFYIAQSKKVTEPTVLFLKML